MNFIKKFWVDALMVVLFVAVSIGYFVNPIRDGQVLTGTDHNAAVGSNVEMEQYRRDHDGERTRWTNTLFCGMPTYQMAPSYPSTEVLNGVESVYQLGLPTVAGYVFMLLLGFYILLRAFDFRAWMAALGAVLWAFSSYYFIIIGAGHIWKLLTLCFIPPTIAGMVLCYRGRYLWGIVVTGIFTALQIFSNHVQMTYYFLLVMALMALAFLIDAIARGQWQQWLKATGAVAVGGMLGLCINVSNLYHTWEYSKESMRSKSELTQKTKDAANQTDSGLERDYITQWSYGIGETWTLLIPNTKGGASIPLAANKTAMEKARYEYQQLYAQIGQYWGEQPGTAGPVYVGAFVVFLFVLGLLIVKGPMKWCLLAATVLSVLLSWGKNFMPFTDFFLDYVPMYDKFRTVASILVIAEFTIPMLGMLALKQLVEAKEFPMKPVLVSLALTAGPCLLFWLMPDIFFGNYIPSEEMNSLKEAIKAGYIPDDVPMNLQDMRRAMFTSDCMRSLMILVVGMAVLMVYRFRRINEVGLTACLAILCLADMWGVNKRYMNDGMFTNPTPAEQSIPRQQADDVILQDTDRYYRVLNMTVSTFNDNTTSYYHKSIGGYHAAKLRRYQELIEAHIAPEMGAAQNAVAQTNGVLEACNGDSIYPVLNMLNMKYMIVGLQDGGRVPVLNPHAMGNAWMVDNVKYVDNADDELALLGKTPLRKTAVANAQYREILGESTQQDSTAQVTLTGYEANKLTYEVNSRQGGVMVMSDIYYPGWRCTVDGQETEVARVNYVLRAIKVEGGKHQVEMVFDPQTVHTTETIARTAMALLLLTLVLAIGWPWVSSRRKKAVSDESLNG